MDDAFERKVRLLLQETDEEIAHSTEQLQRLREASRVLQCSAGLLVLGITIGVAKGLASNRAKKTPNLCILEGTIL